jgi:hypothetical protein
MWNPMTSRTCHPMILWKLRRKLVRKLQILPKVRLLVLKDAQSKSSKGSKSVKNVVCNVVMCLLAMGNTAITVTMISFANLLNMITLGIMNNRIVVMLKL